MFKFMLYTYDSFVFFFSATFNNDSILNTLFKNLKFDLNLE